mmetsp:Transcript_30005/g.46118  ORF Transcript_30005/g.46118 Transcript_30005/m.46118 type:complete len:206 (+) Transcript_30005:426-1043(+)
MSYFFERRNPRATSGLRETFLVASQAAVPCSPHRPRGLALSLLWKKMWSARLPYQDKPWPRVHPPLWMKSLIASAPTSPNNGGTAFKTCLTSSVTTITAVYPTPTQPTRISPSGSSDSDTSTSSSTKASTLLSRTNAKRPSKRWDSSGTHTAPLGWSDGTNSPSSARRRVTATCRRTIRKTNLWPSGSNAKDGNTSCTRREVGPT